LECNLEDIAEYKKECDKNIQKEAEPWLSISVTTSFFI
jgi:hypothetical protein